MRLKVNLDKMLINWEGPDERPHDRCSFCEGPIKEDDVPLVMWSSEGWTARFCDLCSDKYITEEAK